MVLNRTIYNKIKTAAGSRKKLLAVLLDPDKYSKGFFPKLRSYTNSQLDFIFVGGSLTNTPVDELILELKSVTGIPIVLFPGNLLQIDKNADALLLLSLVSGRNPELLIGNHVIAAPFIKQSGLESISTAYLLIESGITTSVEYISNTKPIPRDKTEIVVATAIASELLGFRTLYLEAGSGAKQMVPLEMIKAVKQESRLPLIVGGGIRKPEDLAQIYKAGADLAVVGNILEKNPYLLDEFIEVKKKNS